MKGPYKRCTTRSAKREATSKELIDSILGYIDEAKWLMLANPDLDIKQIGEIVGYADRHYFSRIFKNDDSILCNAAFAASLPHLERIGLLPYHTIAADEYAGLNPPYKPAGARPLSEARMAEIEGIVRGYGKEELGDGQADS